jgi:MFS superfamily sulfate permease-like transporter
MRLVVLDLRELSFIDSSGIHVILDADSDAQREEGRLLIVRRAAQVDRMLTLTEVGKQVMLFDLPSAEPAPALLHVAPTGTCGMSVAATHEGDPALNRAISDAMVEL